jgi:hypothetical protein
MTDADLTYLRTIISLSLLVQELQKNLLVTPEKRTLFDTLVAPKAVAEVSRLLTLMQ